MTKEEILNDIKIKEPRIVYISGKTSTGKTTFAKELQVEGYLNIGLDEIVIASVVEPFKINPPGEAFVIAYRDIGPKEQIDAFISAARGAISKDIATSKIVIDGAIAKSKILKEIFSKELTDFYFVYFHPTDFEKYEKRICERFITGGATDSTGLPKNFWALVNNNDMELFKKTLILNDGLKKAIHDFTYESMKESDKRLDDFKKSFSNIHVVEV